jgi:putative DNA primase/helicase
VALDIAARITRGAAWPDFGKAEAGNVLILSAEDEADDTIVPRLITLGADLSRVTILEAVKGRDGANRMLNLVDDLHALDTAITRTESCFVMIDPLSAYTGRGTNTWRDSDVRTVLTPAAALAAKRHVALNGIMHFNKAADLAALHRVMGSVGFTAAARSVLGFVPHPDRPERAVMVSMKHNLSKAARLLTYELPADCPSVTDIQSLVNPAHKKRPPDREASDEAKAFLMDVLGGGKEVESKESPRGPSSTGSWPRASRRSRCTSHVAACRWIGRTK